jgi:hypothetical protein
MMTGNEYKHKVRNIHLLMVSVLNVIRKLLRTIIIQSIVRLMFSIDCLCSCMDSYVVKKRGKRENSDLRALLTLIFGRKIDRFIRLHRLHRVHQFGLSILFVRSCCRDIENTTLLRSSAADDDDEFCFSDTDATHTPNTMTTSRRGRYYDE